MPFGIRKEVGGWVAQTTARAKKDSKDSTGVGGSVLSSVFMGGPRVFLAHELVVLEPALVDGPVGQGVGALAVTLVVHPPSSVGVAVRPRDGAVAVLLVVHPPSSVGVAVRPRVGALAVLMPAL